MQDYLLKLTNGEVSALKSLSNELNQTPESIILYALSKQFSRFAYACDNCVLRNTCCYLNPGAIFPRSKGQYQAPGRRRCNCSHYKQDDSTEANSSDAKQAPY